MCRGHSFAAREKTGAMLLHRAGLLFSHQFVFQKDAFQQTARLDLLGQKGPGHQLGFGRGCVDVLKVGVVPVDVEDTVVNGFHLLVFECFLNGHGHGDGSADHGVVAHADQAHHLNVCRHRRRTCKLSITVHTCLLYTSHKRLNFVLTHLCQNKI